MFFHINNHILREMCKNKVDEKEDKKPASYTYNPDTWGAGRLLWVSGQPELKRETQDSPGYHVRLCLIYTIKTNEYEVYFFSRLNFTKWIFL